MKTIKPQIIGGVRGARRDVRYIATDEGKYLQETGKNIRKASAALEDAFDFGLDYLDRKRKEEVAAAQLEFEKEEANLRQQILIDSRGANAAGAYDRYINGVNTLRDKYRQNVSSRYLSYFDSTTSKLISGGGRSVWGHENNEIQKHRYSVAKQQEQLMIGNAVSAGDSGVTVMYAEQAVGAYNEATSLTNGGVLYTKESVAAFKSDINDEDGTVTIPQRRRADGTVVPETKLKIVDGQAKDGEISRETLDKMLNSMEAQATAYESGKLAIYDKIHAGKVKALLSADKVEEAYAYVEGLASAEDNSMISAGTLDVLRETVGRHKQVLDDDAAIKTGIKKAVDGAKYYSVEQDARFAAELKAVNDRKDLTPERRARIIQNMRAQYGIGVQIQKTRFAADIAGYWGQWEKDGKTLGEVGSAIRTMESGPLKDALQDAYDKRVAANEAAMRGTPQYHYEQQTKLIEFKVAVSGKRKVKIGNAEYDTTTQEGIKGALYAYGFSGEYAKKAAEYAAKRPKDRVDYTRIMSVVAPFFAQGGQRKGYAVFADTGDWLTHTPPGGISLMVHIANLIEKQIDPSKVTDDQIKVWAAQWLISNDAYLGEVTKWKDSTVD